MVPQLEQMYFARCTVLKGALSKENEPLISSELCVAELPPFRMLSAPDLPENSRFPSSDLLSFEE